MTLLFTGLIIGIIVGRLIGKSNTSVSSPQSPRAIRRSAAKTFSAGSYSRSFDPVSDLMEDMQTGVHLLAEDQRNSNLREAVRINADRRKLESAYQLNSSR